MFGSFSRSVVGLVLWLLLVGLLCFAGYVALKACGLRLWGYEVAWCGSAPANNVARINELYRQIQSLERLKAEPDFCPPQGLVQSRPLMPGVTTEPTVIGPAAPLLGTSGARDPSPAPAPSPTAITPAPMQSDTAIEAPTPNPPSGDLGAVETPVPGGDPAPTDQQANPSGMPIPKPAPHSSAPPPAGDANLDPTPIGPRDAPKGPASPPDGVPPPGIAPPPGSAPPPSSPPPGDGAAVVTPPPGSPNQPNGPNPCPEGTSPKPYIVLALDHSRSMGLPDDIDASYATQLENAMHKGGSAGRKASKIYNGYVDQQGRKRLDVLKDAVATLAEKIDQKIELGVVSFAGCEPQGVVDMGNYLANRRPRLVDKVRALRVMPATPAALALKTAMQKAATVPNGRVIFVSDGKDTCGADPCAVAKAQQGVRVDVISMGGGDVLACVAEATSGRIFTAGENGSVQDLFLALGSEQSQAVCR